MLYNFKKQDIQCRTDCFTCEFFDKKAKRCKGLGKNCFEIDKNTMTVYDPITKLPIKVKENK